MKINEITQDTIAEDIKEMINRDCSQFLKESQGLPLWRGASPNYNLKIRANGILKIPAAVDRSSTSEEGFDAMGASGSIIYDQINSKLFGTFGMARSDSYLFSGSEDIASIYGPIHKCFPLDGYKYLWAPGVDDYVDDLMTYWDENYNDSAGNYKFDQEDWEKFENAHDQTIEWFLEKYKYTSNNLADALNYEGGVEIMIKGPFYIV